MTLALDRLEFQEERSAPAAVERQPPIGVVGLPQPRMLLSELGMRSNSKRCQGACKTQKLLGLQMVFRRTLVAYREILPRRMRLQGEVYARLPARSELGARKREGWRIRPFPPDTHHESQSIHEVERTR